MTRRISHIPHGQRDVYWCWALNEPMVIEFRTHIDDRNYPYCPNCQMFDFDAQPARVKAGYRLGDGFLAYHTFICYVKKPTWSKDYTG